MLAQFSIFLKLELSKYGILKLDEKILKIIILAFKAMRVCENTKELFEKQDT